MSAPLEERLFQNSFSEFVQRFSPSGMLLKSARKNTHFRCHRSLKNGGKERVQFTPAPKRNHQLARGIEQKMTTRDDTGLKKMMTGALEFCEKRKNQKKTSGISTPDFRYFDTWSPSETVSRIYPSPTTVRDRAAGRAIARISVSVSVRG